MKLRSRVAAVGFSAAVVAAGLVLPAVTAAASQTCGGTGSVTTVNGKLADGAAFKLQCPAGTWNGTLFLYSHGYVVPGTNNPATDVGDPDTGAWLLNHGYALAGSSYATTGWAIQQALPDQINTLNRFGSTFSQPTRTIAWGHSLGGIITAGLIQRYPNRFNAALPMCGVLSGGVATWNTAADAAFAFQQLVDPSVTVVNITDPGGNLTGAETAAAAAQKTKQGRARMALVAALGDTPGWFTPLSKEPAPGNFAAQEANQFLWFSQVDGPFIFALRAELEARAGGNVSWTTGVNYTTQLAQSADSAEVAGLYKAAGLNLSADLATLQNATQISADPSAVQYVEHNVTFDGKLSIPVLTMHTTGDGLVVPENESGLPQRGPPRRQRLAAAADLRAPRRALRVHPGGDDHRRARPAAPAVHRPLDRPGDQPRQPEQQGGGARAEVQHLPVQRPGRPDGPGLHPLQPGPVPAAVQPRQPDPVTR